MEPYEQLEREFGEFTQRDPDTMVACASGTAALHLAFLVGAEIQNREEQTRQIICPDYCMLAGPRAISSCQPLEPFFVDVDTNTCNITEETLGDNVKDGLLLVHTYGRKASVPSYRGDLLVEDLAEAHGVLPREDSIACWSFYKNKIIHGEEGGMVSFRDKTEALRAKCLRNMGMDRYYAAEPFGFNYRMSNAHASLILQSLSRYWTYANKRKRCEQLYDTYLNDDWLRSKRDAPWVYDFSLPVGVDARDILDKLLDRDVPVRPGFFPNHQQREWEHVSEESEFPNSEGLADRTLYLPINHTISDRQIKTWVAAVEEEVDKVLS